MAQILHIIPEDGVGGVEIAARSGAATSDSCNLLFLTSNQNVRPDNSVPAIRHLETQNPFSLTAIRGTIRTVDNVNPEVVVFSLWKSFAAFLAIKLLRPQRRFALLLHSDRSVHIPDQLSTAVMARLADAIFSDSAGSLQRLRRPGRFRTRIVSFLRKRVQATPRRIAGPRFIFWGRLHALKNIPAAITFFAMVARDEPGAEFIIIGPDAGMKSKLAEQVTRLGLDDKVRFEGMRSFAEIAELAQDASFFLQLSTQEGMAMSVVEAMQLGLVPVVTPVGEMGRYCRDMKNGIVLHNTAEAFAKVRKLIEDTDSYASLSASAIATWRDKPLYAEDLDAAADELIAAPAPSAGGTMAEAENNRI